MLGHHYLRSMVQYNMLFLFICVAFLFSIDDPTFVILVQTCHSLQALVLGFGLFVVVETLQNPRCSVLKPPTILLHETHLREGETFYADRLLFFDHLLCYAIS